MDETERMAAATALHHWAKTNDFQMPLYEAVLAMDYILSELEQDDA